MPLCARKLDFFNAIESAEFNVIPPQFTSSDDAHKRFSGNQKKPYMFRS